MASQGREKFGESRLKRRRRIAISNVRSIKEGIAWRGELFCRDCDPHAFSSGFLTNQLGSRDGPVEGPHHGISKKVSSSKRSRAALTALCQALDAWKGTEF